MSEDSFRRLGRRLTLRVGGANLVGAVAVWLYLEISLGPAPGEQQVSQSQDLAVFAVVMAVLGAAGYLLGRRSAERACCWIVEQREPTPQEREAALGEPWQQARRAFACWVAAAVVYLVLTVVSTDHSGLHVVRLVDGILLGGVMTSALTYLIAESGLRPVFALALSGEGSQRATAVGIRPRLVLAWALGSGVPLLGLALAPFTHEPGADLGLGASVVVLAVIGLVSGTAATVLVARSIADPLDGVRMALRRVQDGDLSVELPVDDGGEVGMLQRGVNGMVAGLRERARLQDLFGRHVGTEVARQALAQGAGLGSEQREASALFVDLVGSTAMAEVLPAVDVVATLNAFFGAVVRCVGDEGGWVNKFEGDGALALFGAPAQQPDHAARALRAALALDEELRRLATAYPGLEAAIGVSSGSVVAGNVGTDTRYEYTTVGRPVNEAARLRELAKQHTPRVLASGEAVARAGEEASRWSSIGNVALRGQSAPTALFHPRAPVSVP